jgi:hypothetical protein
MYNSGNSSKNVTGASVVDGTLYTVDIADDAVTADKLANSVNADIATGVSGSTTAGDALPKTGGAMTGAITTNSTFDGVDVATRDAVLTSTTNTANAALPLTGGNMTGSVNFGDNKKASFGDGADLQIYSDGTTSYIKENGGGDLKIVAGDDIRFKTADDTQAYATFNQGDSIQLYHNGVEKFATTSTGIDVTGSVTCDGLTSTGIDDNATSNAITIDSSERVGVGTTAPSSNLHVRDASADFSSFRVGGSNIYSGDHGSMTASTGTIAFQISSADINNRSALCKLSINCRNSSSSSTINHPSAVYYFSLILGFGATANFVTPVLTAVHQNSFNKTTDFSFSSVTADQTCIMTFTNPVAYGLNPSYTLEFIGHNYALDSVTVA